VCKLLFPSSRRLPVTFAAFSNDCDIAIVSFPLINMLWDFKSQEFTFSNGLTIPPQTLVGIRIYDIHHNPKYWPDPERFDPERFTCVKFCL
jgi:hypothetical protein